MSICSLVVVRTKLSLGRKALDAHLRADHDVPKTVACNCCGWLFADRSVMMAHSKYLAHNGEPGMSPALAKPIYATGKEPPKEPLFDVNCALFPLTKLDDDAAAAPQHNATTTNHIEAVELDQNQLLTLLVNSLVPNQPYVGKHEATGVEGSEKKPKQPRKRKLLMPKGLVQKISKRSVAAIDKENAPAEGSEPITTRDEPNAWEESVPRKNKRKAFVPVQVKPEQPLSEQQREKLEERFDQARKSVYRITQLVPTNMTPELAKAIAELVTTLR